MNNLEKIKKEFFNLGYQRKPAIMSSLSDGLMSFNIYDDGGFHEICIICDNMEFYNKMPLFDILGRKDISFLSHRYFGLNDPIAKTKFSQVGKGLSYHRD